MKKSKWLILLLILPGIWYFVYINKANNSAVIPGENQQDLVASPQIENLKEVSIEEQIANALADKNNWKPEEVQVSVNFNDEAYSTGGVTMLGSRGGGMWFAVKNNGRWQIVWDGNGTVDCDSLNNFPNYPTKLIPECYDSVTSTLIKR